MFFEILAVPGSVPFFLHPKKIHVERLHTLTAIAALVVVGVGALFFYKHIVRFPRSHILKNGFDLNQVFDDGLNFLDLVPFSLWLLRLNDDWTQYANRFQFFQHGFWCYFLLDFKLKTK